MGSVGRAHRTLRPACLPGLAGAPRVAAVRRSRRLWDWSVADLDRFWTSIVEYFGVEFSTGPTRIRTADPMPFTRWFPGATLNWAQRVLSRGAGDDVALVCVHEGDQTAHEIGFAELRHSVGAFSTWLRRQGVGVGDRIVAYLPNTEHAVIAALASAAVGAVWSCCSPDFGTDGTVGRLAQLEPTVLITVDGYHWNGRVVDRREWWPSCASTCRRCDT